MSQQLSKWVGLLLISGLAGSAGAATLFVDSTGAGGAYTNIEAAFTAAGSNDTIYVRGGQTFNAVTSDWGQAKSGVKLYGGWDGNQSVPKSNKDISPNSTTNLAVANPERLPESVLTTSLNVANTAGDVVNGVTIRGFTFANATIQIGLSGTVATRLNFDFSHNAFTNMNAQGINFQSAGNGSTNVLIRGNRFILAPAATAKTALFIGPGNTAAGKNGSAHFTLIGNYIRDDNPQGITTGAPTGSNNRGVNADCLDLCVIAGNLFDAMGNQSVGNVNSTMDFIIAENRFLGAGKTGRAIIASPRINQTWDSDMERVLISNNEASGHVMQPFDITSFTGAFTGDDGWEALWIRHNRIDVDAAQLQTGGGVCAVSMRFIKNTGGNGPVEFVNNAITITGNRTSSELQAIRIASDAPTAATGGFLFQGNTINASGASGIIPHMAIRFDTNDVSFGAMGAISFVGRNNTMDGFLTAGVGVYDAIPTAVDLPAGASVSITNNNFLNMPVGSTVFVHNVNGPFINALDNFYSNTTDIVSGNVTTNSNAAGAFPVAGRNPNYVTFRGDFNLDNAVNDTDRLVWSNNFGLSGPAATYYKGDATLDQTISAADLLVWKRYNGLDINATAPAAQPTAPAGYPVVKYMPKSGILTIAGNGSAAWGFEVTLVSNTASVSAHSEGNLGAGWAFAAFTNWPATNRIEFVDVSAGGSPAPMAAVQVAQFPANLSLLSFGTVKYYVGSNVFETAVILNDPFPSFVKPVVVGSHAGSSLDWVQASPFANKDQIYFHISGGGNPFPAYTSTLKPDGKYPTGYSQSSVNILPLVGANWCKGSALYKTNVLFLASEGQANSYYGHIFRIDPTTGSGVTAVDFSTAGISRTDTATTYWGGPTAVAVDRVNDKLYVTPTFDTSSANEGCSVARFSINPGTYALTLDFVATLYPSATGAGRNSSYRQLVLPDGYVLALAHNWNSGTAYVAGFNGMAANQAALEASVSTEAAFTFDSAVRGLAFRTDTGAPSGIGYVYIVSYGNSAYNGVIKAYDYKGAGKLSSVIASFDADAALATAGLWTSGNRPRIAALDWTQDGALIVSTRGGNGGTSPSNAAGFVFTFRSARPGTLILVK